VGEIIENEGRFYQVGGEFAIWMPERACFSSQDIIAIQKEYRR
jgi:hypothetical protein